MKTLAIILSGMISLAQVTNTTTQFVEPHVKELQQHLKRLVFKSGQERRRERRKKLRNKFA